MPFPINFLWRSTCQYYLKTLEEGIQTTLYCAMSPEIGKISGRYFRDCKEGKPHNMAYNLPWRRILWEKSVKMVKLTEEDSKIP